MSCGKDALIFLWEKIESILFPPLCYICGKRGKNIICERCSRNLGSLAKYKIEQHDAEIDYFSYHIYLFDYTGNIRKLLLDFKFHDKAYLCEIFVKFLLKNKKIGGFLKNYDIIIPVPIHKKRQKERGYNQSLLLASKWEKEETRISVEDNILLKTKHTKPQSTLSREERIENAKQVYEIQNAEKIKEKDIILLDDIYTTGSTVRECAKILKENGARSIVVVTIAKD